VREFDGHGARFAGTSRATNVGMAAVLALVMLPVIAAIGFFIGAVTHDGSPAAAGAATMFVALAIGVLIGALRLEREAEGPE